MSYTIANTIYRTKGDVTQRCRQILYSTKHEEFISEHDFEFLIELFRYHEKWEVKSGEGVVAITTQMTPHGTPCFTMVRKDGSPEDISFRHVIKLLPTKHSTTLLPQGLLDYRAAARTAIQEQIWKFRDNTLGADIECPITGKGITRDDCSVDHVKPMTFDQLLFDFTKSHDINPLNVEVDSLEGTVAIFTDSRILSDWQNYHQSNCVLRLLSKTGNLQVKSPRLDWSELL